MTEPDSTLQAAPFFEMKLRRVEYKQRVTPRVINFTENSFTTEKALPFSPVHFNKFSFFCSLEKTQGSVGKKSWFWQKNKKKLFAGKTVYNISVKTGIFFLP